MTENLTTELREKLTERGIEWRSGLEGVTFVGDWCFVEYDNGKLAATCEPVLTPEQVIAATLGSDESAVRLAERLRGIADEMRNVGASSMKPHDLLACYAREVDKVADSLKFAATLGNGTCEVIGSYYYDDYDQYEFEFSCGHSVNMYDKEPPNYCPNCGAKIIQGVDNAD